MVLYFVFILGILPKILSTNEKDIIHKPVNNVHSIRLYPYSGVVNANRVKNTATVCPK